MCRSLPSLADETAGLYELSRRDRAGDDRTAAVVRMLAIGGDENEEGRQRKCRRRRKRRTAAGDVGERTQRNGGKADPDRERIDEDGHRQHDLPPSCEPVRHHLRHDDIEQNAADARQNPAEGERSEIPGNGSGESARSHQDETEADNALVADATAERAARQGERHTRQEIEADEGPEIGIGQTEPGNQIRRDRSDGLELEPHAGAGDGQHRERLPMRLHGSSEAVR